MENRVTPPVDDRIASAPPTAAPTAPPTRIPGEPLSFAAASPTSHGWSPPAPAAPTVAGGPTPPPRRGRARFTTGLLAGVALTGAAVGGYAAGQDDTATVANDAPAATVDAVPASAAPTSIGDLVEAARPSVVSVRQVVTQQDPFGGTRQGQSAGTGFVLSSDGYIVTNNHVIEQGDSPVVTFADGTSEPATIVAGDPSRDLAVLRVDRTDLVPLAVGDSEDLRLGDQLIAVGYALDLDGEPSVTAGVLSAKNRTIGEPNGAQLVNLLQTDTAINPGNSGGPLLNDRGEVVGINTAVAGQAENIGFAIAITPVVDVIDDLRNGTVPGQALMGVTSAPTDDGLGVEIVEIGDGSGADAGGLRVGDVIVAVDGDDITDPVSLGVAIRANQPGDTVTVTVERNGSTQEFAVTLGTRST